MAVLLESDVGWLICHKRYLEILYNQSKNLSDVVCRLVPNFDIFNIESTFLMDSAVKKQCSIGVDCVNQKRKRKCSTANNNDYEHYNEVKDFVQNAIDLLVEDGKRLGYFCSDPLSCSEKLKNNSSPRKMAKVLQYDNLLSQYCEENVPLLYITKTEDVEVSNVEVIKVDEVHKDPSYEIFSFLGQKYVVPNSSQFLLADVRHLNVLTKISGNKFDVILLDPPWCNKSVKRKKGYWMLSNDELLDLPICTLANSQCLVIVWTTNNQKQISFVKSQLFPRWSIQYCAEWHWLKVTKQGIPIHPLESHHKKPYENLILGERKTISSSISKIPNHRVIVSVPSSIHSHKPPLTEILKPYVPENPKCLEIFARYLLPGWTSCGNEVLKLQHTKMFETFEDKSNS